MEQILRRTGEPRPAGGDAPAAAGASTSAGDCPALRQRPAYEYLTLRGNEELSLCIAARANLCKQVDLVYWERRVDGTYKTESGKWKDGHTRIMVAELTFDATFATFGDKARVCAVHLHRGTAKFARNFKVSAGTWWARLAKGLKEKDVDILAGDFNMALTQVVPRLREHGVSLETAAVYFWRGFDGTPCMPAAVYSSSTGLASTNCAGR